MMFSSEINEFFKTAEAANGGVLKNFSVFTGKRLCWSLFAGLQGCNFIKKRLQHRRFPVNICEQLLLKGTPMQI